MWLTRGQCDWLKPIELIRSVAEIRFHQPNPSSLSWRTDTRAIGGCRRHQSDARKYDIINLSPWVLIAHYCDNIWDHWPNKAWKNREEVLEVVFPLVKTNLKNICSHIFCGHFRFHTSLYSSLRITQTSLFDIFVEASKGRELDNNNRFRILFGHE